LGISIVTGSLELHDDDLFNVALCVTPNGLLGAYRKTHLPALGVDHFTQRGYLQDPTAAYQVLDLGELRIGMLICYDASFPEASRILALRGADLIVLPTNWPPGAEQTAEHVINARASENKVFYAAANRVGHENGFDFIGKSKICDVHGSTLASADHRQEEILYANIDASQARNKRINRGKGHSIERFADRRPDLYGEIAISHSTNTRTATPES
jgi:predicted amidohydrolase